MRRASVALRCHSSDQLGSDVCTGLLVVRVQAEGGHDVTLA